MRREAPDVGQTFLSAGGEEEESAMASFASHFALPTLFLALPALPLVSAQPSQKKPRDTKQEQPPKLNPLKPPGPAPEGMVWVAGGEFWMGIDIEQVPESCPDTRIFDDASHVHKVYV